MAITCIRQLLPQSLVLAKASIHVGSTQFLGIISIGNAQLQKETRSADFKSDFQSVLLSKTRRHLQIISSAQWQLPKGSLRLRRNSTSSKPSQTNPHMYIRTISELRRRYPPSQSLRRMMRSRGRGNIRQERISNLSSRQFGKDFTDEEKIKTEYYKEIED